MMKNRSLCKIWVVRLLECSDNDKKIFFANCASMCSVILDLKLCIMKS